MKTLLLARHAKSSWDDGQVDDINRPLNERGEKDAPLMADHLRQSNFCVDQIVSSDAHRAYSTAEIYAASLKVQLQHDHGLYMASSDDIVKKARQLNDQFSSVMLVGHNPSMTEAVNTLCADTGIEDMPTCSVAIIEFDVDRWSDIDSSQAALTAFEFPKKLA